MFCRTCGKPLEDSLKFCPSCGVKVDQAAEVNISKNTSSIESSHDYAGDLKKAFNNFVSYFCAVIKDPTKALENAHMYLTNKKALAFTAILALIYGIIQSVLIIVITNGIKGMMSNMMDGFGPQVLFRYYNGMGNQVLQQDNQFFKLFIINFLFILIFVSVLSGLSFVVYTLIMKKNSKFMDFVKIYLSSLVILVVISIINVLAAVINLKLMVIIMVIGSLLYLITMTVNFVNFLRNEAKVIYTLPVVMFSSLFISYYIYMKMF